VLFTIIFAIAICIGTIWQITGVAAAVMLIHWGAIPIFVMWIKKYITKPSLQEQT
jgi:O-antigen/teichoic acid export membrane protein